MGEQNAPAGQGPMTATPATRVLGGVAVLATVVALLLGLVVSPKDVVQGDAVRLLYVHVPVIWIAYGSFGLTSLASALYLWRGRRRADSGRHYDRLAGAAAECGVLFTGLTLISGALWGKITWGTYWQWDARLTTTVLLFITYIGYLALRRLPADPTVRSKRSAIMALASFVNVPIVHFSVDWWRTLHQQESFGLGEPEITGEMLWSLLFSTLTMTIVAAWLMVHRYRVIRLEEMLDDEGLCAAIEARQAEAVGS